jgi:peroxiredoxin
MHSRRTRSSNLCTAALGLASALALGSGCQRHEPPPTSPEIRAVEPTAESAGADPANAESASPRAATPRDGTPSRDRKGPSAGVAAPDFALPDLDGQLVKLSNFRGKVVVLEWFNPECPFVRLSHTKGSLLGLADKFGARGVVWLAINSAAPGRQGHGPDISRAGQSRFRMKHPILLDESGEIGKAYGAERTPHMYVINQQGTLVYRGAIDNSPDGEGEAPQGAELVNYVERALQAVLEGQPVAVAQTEAYGCTVKYAE